MRTCSYEVKKGRLLASQVLQKEQQLAQLAAEMQQTQQAQDEALQAALEQYQVSTLCGSESDARSPGYHTDLLKAESGTAR